MTELAQGIWPDGVMNILQGGKVTLFEANWIINGSDCRYDCYFLNSHVLGSRRFHLRRPSHQGHLVRRWRWDWKLHSCARYRQWQACAVQYGREEPRSYSAWRAQAAHARCPGWCCLWRDWTALYVDWLVCLFSRFSPPGMALPVAIFVGESQAWIPELVEKARKLTVGPGTHWLTIFDWINFRFEWLNSLPILNFIK